MANEPHTTDGYEWGTLDQSCKSVADGRPGTIVNQWLGEMTTYVRSLDTVHMISTGEEGYRTDGDTSGGHGWINGGLKGVDFTRDVALPNVSFATTHLYPDNWDIPASEFASWYVPHVIVDRAAVAHAAGKPIIVEETGFSKLNVGDTSQFMQKVQTAGYADNRAKWLTALYTAANEAGYAER